MKKIYRVIIHIIIIVLQIVLLINYNKNYYIKKELKIEKKSIEYTLSKQINPIIKEDEESKKNIINKEKIIEYDMILEIHKINLKKGIFKKNDKKNNIDKNVTILKQSSYPNKNGNIFLIAHSGTSKKSFFKRSNKLNKKDIAYIYYKEKMYKNEVRNIYEIEKDNNIILKTDNVNNLFLITCSQNNKSNYLIVELKKTDD